MMDLKREIVRVLGAMYVVGLVLLIGLIVMAVLSIAGCAHERVVIETVETKVPVMVPCAAPMPADPERPTQRESAAADIFEAMKRALAEIENWRAWAVEAKAAVKGCEILRSGEKWEKSKGEQK